jgi:hypothetical protein
MKRSIAKSIGLALLVVASLFGATTAASAAETQRVNGLYGTTIGVSQFGCRTEQGFSSSTKTLYVEEPIIRNAASPSFTSARLSVYVYSKAKGTTAWKYEPALSYAKTAVKSVPSILQPTPVVSFNVGSRAINLAWQGEISIVERVEYLDRNGSRVGSPIDLNPSPYTYVNSYWLGINQFVTGTCQF